jgi:hypothetical protein
MKIMVQKLLFLINKLDLRSLFNYLLVSSLDTRRFWILLCCSQLLAPESSTRTGQEIPHFFLEPKTSLPYSKQRLTGPYPEPD